MAKKFCGIKSLASIALYRSKPIDKDRNMPVPVRGQAVTRFSSEDTMRKVRESRNRARKLIRKAGASKAKSKWQMRKEWNALLRKEEEKRRAEAKAGASSIFAHIVR